MTTTTPNLLYLQKVLQKKNQALLILNSQYDTLEVNYSQLTSKHGELESKIHEIEDQLLALKHQNEAIEKASNTFTIESSVLAMNKVDFQVLESEKEVLSKVNRQLQDVLHNREKELELVVKQRLRKEHMHYENVLSSKKVQLDNKEIELQVQEKELEQYQLEVSHLETEVKKIETLVAEELLQKNKREKQLQETQNLLEKHEKECTTLEYQNIDRDKEIAALNIQILQLRYEIKDMTTIINHRHGLLKNLRTRKDQERQLIEKRSEFLKKTQSHR